MSRLRGRRWLPRYNADARADDGLKTKGGSSTHDLGRRLWEFAFRIPLPRKLTRQMRNSAAIFPVRRQLSTIGLKELLANGESGHCSRAVHATPLFDWKIGKPPPQPLSYRIPHPQPRRSHHDSDTALGACVTGRFDYNCGEKLEMISGGGILLGQSRSHLSRRSFRQLQPD